MTRTFDYLATDRESGDLNAIKDCWIQLPGFGGDDRIELNALPEISDAKTVSYADQTIQGRAAPVKTYASSDNRTISFTMHLYVTKEEDVENNLRIIRAIAALTHPEYNGSYLPPKIARIKCGNLLGSQVGGVPVVLKSYNVQYDTAVQWYEVGGNYMPLHVSIASEWDVIYSWQLLPGHDSVLRGEY